MTPQIPLPAQIVEDNICTDNPVAQLLLEQMAHPASMITQVNQLALDTLPTTVVDTATTVMKLTAETKMSRIILSCGHEVYDVKHAYTIMSKSTNRYGDPAVKYQTTCGPCEDRYRQQGRILDTEHEALEWLKDTK